MKHSSLLLGMASAVLISGCMPAAPSTGETAMSSSAMTSSAAMADASSSASSEAPAGAVVIAFDKKVTEDDLATIHTTAALRMTGAITEEVDLGEILGELVQVDPSAYGTYAKDGTEVIAVFTAWWAGQGEEIIVRHDKTAAVLSVDHRYGDESGSCTEPQNMAEFPLAASSTLELQDTGETAAQSSLKFCYE